MPDSSHLSVFLAAAFLLAITPGPGIFFVLARSLAGGRREGILSAFGTLLGGLVHVAGAALGVSAVLAASALAFAMVKYAGAAYLIYLGIRMIRSRNIETPEHKLNVGSRNSLTQGILTEVLNPKTALFFLSFIPQFIAPARGHVFAQFLLLGTISVMLNTSADLAAAFFAGPLGHRLKHNANLRRRQRTASGLVMIGLGTWVAVGERK
jgi:threonine/homoserine/homoserine lactone efflux protein